MNLFNSFLIFSLISAAGYGIGLLVLLRDFEDKCEMTYMFEYPQFVRISHKLDEKYPKYGLYAYSEGRFTSYARNMDFSGIPVLFIPGNAGSFKQVRSMASVALRKALSSGSDYHFDYFTIDLNSEFSGLYGPLLYDQLEYTNSSLHRILDLYKKIKIKPNSVVLIGHSMGGVIALKLLTTISDHNLIPILITLATPIKRPPIFFDFHMEMFYSFNYSQIPESTNIVSISGGYSDFLIPPALSQVKKNGSLFAVTTNIPRAWVQTNHVQILWCKQLTLALNRALFDMVIPKKKQISNNSSYRSLVFNHHLVQHSGIYIKYHHTYLEETSINYRGQWIESILKQYTIKFMNGIKEPHWYMVRLSTLPGYEILSVLALNLENVDWVYICNANFPRGPSKVCTQGFHLTHLSEIAPSVKFKRRHFQLNLKELIKNYSDMTHVVIKVMPTDEPVVLHFDIHSENERNITVNLPQWWSFDKKVILHETIENSLYYKLNLPELLNPIQFYQLFIEPISCTHKYHHASASLISPWSYESQHGFFTHLSSSNASGNIRLYSSRPKDSAPAYIKLLLEPSCKYRVSITPSLMGSLGQIARIYSPLLPSNIAVIILMSLKYQLHCLEKNQQCSILLVPLQEGIKPYYVLTATILILRHWNWSRIVFLPSLDTELLNSEGTDFILIPLFLFLCSMGIVYIFAVLLVISMVLLESTIHKSALKILARSVSFNISWSDYLMKAFHKVPFVVVSLLIFLCISTCGALALWLGVIFYFLRLTQMSQDFVENVVWFVAKKIASKIKNYLRKKIHKSENKTTATINVATEEQNKIEDIPSREIDNSDEKGDSEIHIESKENVTQTDDKVKDLSDQCDLVNKENNEENDTIPENVIIAEKEENEEEKASLHENKESELSDSYSSIHFHSTLFLLWLIIALNNIPAVLTWAHNFQYSKILSPDDSFIPGIVLSFCALPLWQSEFPRSDRKWLDKLQVFIMGVAVVSLLFATISIYRLNYLLSLTIVTVILQQLLAPKAENIINHQSDNTKYNYENVKAKLD